MSDFLERLVDRALAGAGAGASSVVPRLPSLYEPERLAAVAALRWEGEEASEVQEPVVGGHSRTRFEAPGRAADPGRHDPFRPGRDQDVASGPALSPGPVDDRGAEPWAHKPAAASTARGNAVPGGDGDGVDDPVPPCARLLRPSGRHGDRFGEAAGTPLPLPRPLLSAVSPPVNGRPASPPFDREPGRDVAIHARLEPRGERSASLTPAFGDAPMQPARPVRRAVPAHASAAESGPVINVTIGRIEVRALPPSAPPARTEHRAEGGGGSRPLSLDDYLRQRGAGR